MAILGVTFRKGATVTAFSIASISTASRSVKAAPRANSLFSRALTPTSRLSGVTTLRQSTTAVEAKLDLVKTLDVTHPSYEVLQRDVVDEYGAYCTLFRHKKSGAELLSVSVEDDNKVRTKERLTN